MIHEGAIIGGKYRVDRLIGQGGMGMVVAATNSLLGQPVALKFLLPELLNHSGIVERFLREARASARLKSEHVCRVFDVGMENGVPFIIMELLEGRDLQSIVEKSGLPPISTTVDYVLQACVGLAEAHAQRIVHRDLKPSNLFVAKRPDGSVVVKVLDFGIAKASGDTQFQLTRTAAVVGSPGYMSPEQLRSARDADVRSDIWALGVILYELVSGRQPFAAESITELALRVAMDPLPPLPPGLPRDLDKVIARCLEKDPARRYQNIAELARALVPYGGPRASDLAGGIANMLASSGAGSPPVAVPAAPGTPTTLGSSAGSISQGPARSNRRLAGILAGFVGAGAVAAIVIVLATRGGGGETASSGSEPAKAASPEPSKAEAPAAAPPRVEPPKTEPPKTEPPKTEPPKTEPPKAEPPKTEPAKAEPAKTEPAKTEPAKTEPPKPPKPPKPRKPVTPQKPVEPATPPADFGNSRT